MTIADDSVAGENSWPAKVAILGVGLLGGSVALSMRRVRPATQFIGWARNDQKCDHLKSLGVVQAAVTSIEQACSDCDVVVAAAPVDRIADLVVQASRCSGAECLITDVGSTKKGIVQAVDRHGAGDKFVAAHPIAGSEKSGADHASQTLFDGKLVVLTPTESTGAKLLEKAERFWTLTGGSVLQMSPAAHDAHLAAVSHVPHLVSAMVARMAGTQARPLVGSGWRDITRVAAGDPSLWTAICQQNRHAISEQLARFAEELNQLRRIVDGQDDEALWSWLAEAKRMKQQD